MAKRSVSRTVKSAMAVALSLVLAVGQVPFAFADEESSTLADDQSSSYLNADDYAALGLPTDDDTSAAGEAPYSTTTATMVVKKDEVYTAANGVGGNRYIIRNGLDSLLGRGDLTTNLTSDDGQTYGAGKLWEAINDYGNDDLLNEGKYGGGTSSFLSTSGTVLKNENQGFSGIYAKSVSFSNTSGNDAKQNCIAELRAYGDSHSTTVGYYTVDGGIVVELMSVDENGNRTSVGTLTPTVVSSQTDTKEFYYLKTGYVQSLESYFDIASGDVDGDGVDEIFVYAGCFRDYNVDQTRRAVVNMFKRDLATNQWVTYETEVVAGLTADYETSHREGDYGEFEMQASPIVTLATGDLDRNGCADLAITVSAAYCKKNVSSARCELFTWSDSAANLVHVDGIGDIADGAISLAGPDGKAMVSANCTFGTFAQYDENGVKTGDTVEGLIIAGYESLSSQYWYTHLDHLLRYGYRFVYYDFEKGEYQISDYLSGDLGINGRIISNSAGNCIDQDGRFSIALAPIALACANLYGIEASDTGDGGTSTATTGSSENDAVLLAGDIYGNFICSTSNLHAGMNSVTGRMSLCTEHYNSKDKHDQKGVEHVWIGDVEVGCVSNSDSCNESFIAVLGFHRDEDLGKNDDYYWMDLAHYTMTLNDGGVFEEKTGQEQVICESNRKNSQFGTWISLCLPDIDKDGARMTYLGETKTYTNPEVLAVLQDAPYYQDLQDAYGYLVLGGTGFKKSSGSETSSDGVSVEGELGPAGEFNIGFLAGIKVAGEIHGKGGYDYIEMNKINYSSSYESHAGEGDKVVIYTMPTLMYIYEVEEEATGKKDSIALPISLGYQTSVVSVEKYNEIVEGKKIDENGTPCATIDYLSETSGNPSTYKLTTGDSFGQGAKLDSGESVSRKYTSDGTQATTSSAGATTEVSIESESTTEQEYQVGGSIDLELEFGFKVLGQEEFVGISGGIGAVYKNVWSSSKGVEFTGAVDNLPEAAGDKYEFTWNLGVNEYSNSNTGSTYWIIGYDVKSVTEPAAPAVRGFAATEETSSSISFEWDDVLGSRTGYQYAIGMLDANDKVSAWKIVDASETSYTWENLDAKTNYRFVMATIAPDGGESIPTPVVNATTLPDGMTLSIEGVDVVGTNTPLQSLPTYSVTAGSTLNLYALGAVSGTDDNTLYYTWYKRKSGAETAEVVKREQVTLGGESSLSGDSNDAGTSTPEGMSVLTLTSVASSDDGAEYYCVASQDQYSISTAPIRVDVETSQSTTTEKTAKVKFLSIKSSPQAKVFTVRDSANDPTVQEKVVNPDDGGNGGSGGSGGNNITPGGSLVNTGDNQSIPLIVGLSLFAVLVAGAGVVFLRKRNLK